MLKRQKTEADSCVVEKKPANNPVTNLTNYFNFNTQEITLTIIPKNNNPNGIKDLMKGKIQTSPITKSEEESVDRKVNEDKKHNNRLPTNIPPVVLALLEKSEEIQLTKLGSNDNVKLVKQNEVANDCSKTDESMDITPDSSQKSLATSEQKNNFLDTNSITELSEVTIEPCSSSNKSKAAGSSSPSGNLKTKTPTRTSLRIERAQELLKKKKIMNKSYCTSSFNESFNTNLRMSQTDDQNFDYDCKDFNEERHFHSMNYMRSNSPLFDEEPDHHIAVSSISDYEPFNVGVSCEHFYGHNKDKPHYTAGFPNPPGENRCWINATLQALFTVPIINKLDSLDIPEPSVLLASLIAVQTSWRKGITGNQDFNDIFR